MGNVGHGYSSCKVVAKSYNEIVENVPAKQPERFTFVGRVIVSEL